MNIWDTELSREDIDKFENCEPVSVKPLIDWDKAEEFWKLEADGDALVQIQKPRKDLCLDNEKDLLVGFGKQRSFIEAMKLCSSMNGYLPVPKSQEQEEKIINLMAKKSFNCLSNFTFIGITDNQKEGTFVDVSHETYREVFYEMKSVGQKLTEKNHTNWAPTQPNGGISQNCVVANPSGWEDVNCDFKGCVACSLDAFKSFKLRGLCELSEIDKVYQMVIREEQDGPIFIGKLGWTLQWDDYFHGFSLNNSFLQKEP